jgi:hypothetical protein
MFYFRTRLPEQVRSLEKVAQRSTVALKWFMKLPIGGARSRDAPIRLPNQICFYEKTFPFATCCKFERIPWNDVLSIFHIHHDGLDFFRVRVTPLLWRATILTIMANLNWFEANANHVKHFFLK